MKAYMSFGLAVLLCAGTALFASEPVRQAQEALKAQGYDPGPADGLEGPKTRAAVRKYQTDHKIVANGRLGGETYSSLGVKRDVPAKEMDKAGSNLTSSYAKGGKDMGQGGKDLGHDLKHGQVTDAAKDFGSGVGSGAKKMGVGTGKAAKNAAKGVKDAFTPHDKK